MDNQLQCAEVVDTAYGVFEAVIALRGRAGAEGSQCRFGYGDPRGLDFHYCRSTAQKGSSYCPDHFNLCTPKRD